MGISGLRPSACQKPREFCVISKLEIPIYITISEIKRTNNNQSKLTALKKCRLSVRNTVWNQSKSKAKNKLQPFWNTWTKS